MTKADDKAQLFNLADDPQEEHDLAAAQPVKVKQMRGLLGRLAQRDNDAKVGDAKPE